VLGLSEGVGEKAARLFLAGPTSRELRNVDRGAQWLLTRFDRLTLDDLPEKVRNYRSFAGL